MYINTGKYAYIHEKLFSKTLCMSLQLAVEAHFLEWRFPCFGKELFICVFKCICTNAYIIIIDRIYMCVYYITLVCVIHLGRPLVTIGSSHPLDRVRLFDLSFAILHGGQSKVSLIPNIYISFTSQQT